MTLSTNQLTDLSLDHLTMQKFSSLIGDVFNVSDYTGKNTLIYILPT